MDANNQIGEMCEEMIKNEKTRRDYEQQINELNQQLAIKEQLQIQQAEKTLSLEKKLEQSIRAEHEADKRAAVAEMRCLELEKQLTKQERKVVQPKQPKAKKPK